MFIYIVFVTAAHYKITLSYSIKEFPSTYIIFVTAMDKNVTLSS
jgi:hypothetical protein